MNNHSGSTCFHNIARMLYYSYVRNNIVSLFCIASWFCITLQKCFKDFLLKRFTPTFSNSCDKIIYYVILTGCNFVLCIYIYRIIITFYYLKDIEAQD